MRLLFINNHGGGYCSYLDVAEGMRIEELIAEKLPDVGEDELLIRVNRQPVARDYVLQEGDRVSATPTKIKGALAA